MLLRGVFLAAVFAASSQAIADNTNAQVVKGVIDLRQWDFGAKGSINISGEWELYWGKLLTPAEIHSGKISIDTFLRVPGYFHDVGYPSLGVATLRAVILSPRSHEYLTVYINDVLSSYKVWLDGVYLGQVGEVAEKNSIPDYFPMVFNFPADSSAHEIVIQIANHSHAFGGIYSPIRVGTPRSIMIQRFAIAAKNIIACVALIVMAVFNFMLFRLRSKEPVFLYMGIFAFLLGYRSLFSEEKLIVFAFPNLSWQWIYKLDFWGFYLGVPVFLGYTVRVFPKMRPIGLIRAIQIFLILCSIFVLFTPVIVNFYTLNLVHITVLITVVVVVYNILYLSFKGVLIARFFIIAIFLIAAAAVNDILLHQGVISSVELAHFGAVAFIFFQTYELYQRFDKTFVENEKLRLQLEDENKQLEGMVHERTRELVELNQELLENQQELMSLADALQSATIDLNNQKKEIELQHDRITQSIIYASRIQNSLLPSNMRLNRIFPDGFFVLWYPRDIVGGDFYWTTTIENRILVAGGDCTGHGVPGALLSMLCIATLNEAVRRPEINSPAEILDFVRTRIKLLLQQNNDDRKEGADMAVCEFDKTTGRMIFASGRMPILIFRQNSHPPFSAPENSKIYHYDHYEVLKLNGDKQPVGPHPNEHPFSNTTLFCEKGDRFYIYSDGFQDQFGGDENLKMGFSRFLELLISIQDYPLNAQKEPLVYAYDSWKGQLPQIDDVMIFAFQWSAGIS